MPTGTKMDDSASDQPYRGGELEAAARRAREEAAASPPPVTANEDLVAEIRKEAAAAGGRSPDEAGADTAPPPETSSAPPATTSTPPVTGAPEPDPTPATATGAAAPPDDPGDEEYDEDYAEGSFLAFLRELPVLLGVAFLLAFLLRTFVVQVFYIPSGSMRPLLEVNDRIVVEKLSYRFGDPQRGDVVVFAGPESSEPSNEPALQRITRGIGQFLGVVPVDAQDFVKRVIGLPGDEIEIVSGVVYVNGVALDEPYAVEDPRSFGPFVVPEGQLFFLGDNRPNSSDSRIPTGLGYVDEDRVVGRALVVVWPFDHFGGIGRLDYAGVPEDPPADGAADTDSADTGS